MSLVHSWLLTTDIMLLGLLIGVILALFIICFLAALRDEYNLNLQKQKILLVPEDINKQLCEIIDLAFDRYFCDFEEMEFSIKLILKNMLLTVVKQFFASTPAKLILNVFLVTGVSEQLSDANFRYLVRKFLKFSLPKNEYNCKIARGILEDVCVSYVMPVSETKFIKQKQVIYRYLTALNDDNHHSITKLKDEDSSVAMLQLYPNVVSNVAKTQTIDLSHIQKDHRLHTLLLSCNSRDASDLVRLELFERIVSFNDRVFSIPCTNRKDYSTVLTEEANHVMQSYFHKGLLPTKLEECTIGEFKSDDVRSKPFFANLFLKQHSYLYDYIHGVLIKRMIYDEKYMISCYGRPSNNYVHVAGNKNAGELDHSFQQKSIDVSSIYHCETNSDYSYPVGNKPLNVVVTIKHVYVHPQDGKKVLFLISTQSSDEIDDFSRFYEDFYILENQLKRFYGAKINVEFPPKRTMTRDMTFMRSCMRPFEDRLNALVNNPYLKSSTFLRVFLDRSVTCIKDVPELLPETLKSGISTNDDKTDLFLRRLISISCPGSASPVDQECTLKRLYDYKLEIYSRKALCKFTYHKDANCKYAFSDLFKRFVPDDGIFTVFTKVAEILVTVFSPAILFFSAIYLPQLFKWSTMHSFLEGVKEFLKGPEVPDEADVDETDLVKAMTNAYEHKLPSVIRSESGVIFRRIAKAVSDEERNKLIFHNLAAFIVKKLC